MNSHNERDTLNQSPFGELPTETVPLITAQLAAFEDFTQAIYDLHALRCTARFFNSIHEIESQLDDIAFFHPQIAVGSHQLFVVTHDGRLFGCGTNDHGELGLGLDGGQYHQPVAAKQLTAIKAPNNQLIKQVAVRDHTMLALSTDNALFRCGTFNDIPSLVEIKITLPNNASITQIAWGNKKSWLHTSDGKLYEFKIIVNNTEAQLKEIPLPNDLIIKKMVVGDNHLVLLSTQGKVYGHGDNGQGQLGFSDNRKTELGVAEITLPKEVPSIKDVVAGNAHTVFLTSRNELYGCGKNNVGQLGSNSNAQPQLTLTKINLAAAPGVTAKQIAAGDNHTAVLTTDGKVYRCGSNADGQMGLPSTTDHLSQLTEIKLNTSAPSQIIAGSTRTFVRTQDGKMYGWGADKAGQMGQNNTNPEAEKNAYSVREIDIACTKPKNQLEKNKSEGVTRLSL